MECCDGELAGSDGQRKRRKGRSHASDSCTGNCSLASAPPSQGEAEMVYSTESSLFVLPQLDSFAFAPPRDTPKIREEEKGTSNTTASSQAKKPWPAPAEEYRGNPLKLHDIHAGVIPSFNLTKLIVDSDEDHLPNFGDDIPGACDALVDIALQLVADLDCLTFKAPVSCVYNPLVYAQDLYVQYIRKHGGRRVEVLLVGMNPGPFGMAQTGVPFGDCKFVKTFHGLSGEVESPKILHPKRPVIGLNCKRSEVSGQRLWGWAQDRFGCATAFFNRFWVYNYCPLVFMEASGKNRTPDKLHPSERAKLELACNNALIKTVSILRPAFVVGVGKYAAIKIQACNIAGVKVGDIMHPSPANPQANKDWGKKVEEQLLKLGVVLDA